MNTNENKTDYCKENQTLAGAAVATCQKLITQIEQAKNRLMLEYAGQLTGHEAVLRHALGQAEALAWDTNYPQLVFATLAREKAQAAAAWETRQRAIYRQTQAFTVTDGASRN